jgi:hypothetical protein
MTLLRSSIPTDSIRARRYINTPMHESLRVQRDHPNNAPMVDKEKKLSELWAELLREAAVNYPALWKNDKDLNLAAVARHYEKHGYPIPQPTLHRLYFGRHDRPSEGVIAATHAVFKIPLEMLRSERVSRDLEQLLERYPLQVLLLAERIGKLNKLDRDAMLLQLEAAEDRQRQIDELRKDPKVTVLDRTKR